MDGEDVDVSIVIPCLNEENSIGIVVEKAWQALRAMNVSGEVVVADNGSTDRSAEIARSRGARVVAVPEKGYGNALRGGIEAARGRYIVMGDADDSYDFLETPRLLAPLREGADIVIGSRFRGTILPGAMRWSSRIGNPLVTAILNLLFRSRLSDSQSGMRAFTREAWQRLRLQSTGMEFASEMLIQARRAGLRIAEVPITFHPDRRGRPPHLHPIRDGWRHLKLMLTYSPTVLFLAPGGLMMLLGLLLMGVQLLAPMDQPLWLGPVRLDFHWAILGSLLTLSGYTLIQAHFLAKIYSVTHRFQEQDRVLEVGFRLLTAERVLLLSLLAILLGLGIDGWVLYDWIAQGYGALVSGHTRLVIFGSTLAALGIQAFFHAFLFSIMGDAYKRR
ncbi:MAG: glycosyltransferase family 2 protein [Anaerolineae bacterium]|nr:glycosyltransferase family 2 protein [Anaerolineae bacterium]MDW8067649.1 glycosyltransferase family 2 protein [Anaerolineae bacterium]